MESNRDGDYVRLEDGEDGDGGVRNVAPPDIATSSGRWWRWGVKVIGLCILAGISVVIIVNWLGPPLMNKVIVPTIDWVTRSFDRPTLAFLIFATTALFPALMLPSTPSIWIAGMSFGYVTGFAIVMAGITIGVTLPYFIGLPFRQKIQVHVSCEFFEPVSVKTTISQGSPIFPEMVGEIPEAGVRSPTSRPRELVSSVPSGHADQDFSVSYDFYLDAVGLMGSNFVLFRGKLIRKLADATEDHHRGLSRLHIAVNMVGFSASMIATMMSSRCAKVRLEERRRKEELTLG
ncbi:uncharacterized protein LOC104443258 [Eucalyptus grandis]|uniref:uncharacterized protein LOC104443258 n=1 Tax=Eucalyptus grandis TaxID=71139 RepID=UPI00192F114A|nr:uncharacterized protein LOC104443258 [Eucalyptus grandis]